jgi:hypothetical protein
MSSFWIQRSGARRGASLAEAAMSGTGIRLRLTSHRRVSTTGGRGLCLTFRTSRVTIGNGTSA